MNYSKIRFLHPFAMALIGLMLTACGGNQETEERSSAVSEDSLPTEAGDTLMLVPGKSAGFIKLGEADSALHQRLGQPHFSDAAMGKAVMAWYMDDDKNNSLSVFTSRDMGNDETARIQQIRVTSPRFETSDSIRVGSSLDEISNHYARTLHIAETYEDMGESYTVYGTNDGIAFEIDTTNHCVAIIIHEANADISSYLPLRTTH